MNVIQLPPRDILKWWPQIEPWFAKAAAHGEGESTTYDYFMWAQNPEYAQVWVVFDNNKPVNVSLTKVNKYPQHTSLHLVLTANCGNINWDAYKEAHHEIEKYAERIGASRIEFYGRAGWAKTIGRLTGHNGQKYRPSYVVYSMDTRGTQ